MSDIITKDQFDKIDMRVGEIVAAEPFEGNFTILTINDGSGKLRQIVTEIQTAEPVGLRVIFVTNLPVNAVHGVESEGIVLTVSDGNYRWFVTPDRDAAPGTRVT